MNFKDKSITCAGCGESFTFTASEQEFFANKGFVNEPKRCSSCRQAKKADRGGGGTGRPREMFPAVCAQCGEKTQVPFEPRNDKPVYCSSCFSNTRQSR